MSPYRQPPVPNPAANADEDREGSPDGELMPVFFLFWVGSIARFALGVAHHETFGTEVALAFLAIFAVPYLMRDAILWWPRRIWRRLRR